MVVWYCCKNHIAKEDHFSKTILELVLCVSCCANTKGMKFCNKLQILLAPSNGYKPM
jgi:hypothetical protein